MLRRMTRGFTLVELLIVACILAILVALLMPAMGQAWVVADNTRCTTNLYRISQAVGMRAAEEGMGIKSSLKARYWCAQLLPYLERKTEFLLCPVPNVAEVNTWTGEGSEAVTDGGGQMTWDGGALDKVATDEAAAAENRVQLTDLAEHKVVTGSATTYYTPLEEGRWCIKLSNEQYAAARAANLLPGGSQLRTNYPSLSVYSPGSNRRQYWLCIEDHGGDEDYKDVMVHATDNEDGSFTLAVHFSSVGNSNSIVDLPDHKELCGVPGGTAKDVTLTLRDETSGSGSSGGGAGSSFGGGVGGSELTADAGGSATTNYGMNANYADVAGKAGKIAVMDYHRYQVRPDADVWSDPEIDPNADGIPVFARHWKKVNVLFTDGSVSLMDPKDIDPNVPSIEDKYWNP